MAKVIKYKFLSVEINNGKNTVNEPHADKTEE